jgi:tRNA1Val (adenine37-N6)-methyltransferase
MEPKFAKGKPDRFFAGDGDPKSFSVEYLFDGALAVRQPKKGYRYSLDSILLARFATPGKKRRILDLGAGCGIISLILAKRHPRVEIYGVEIQPSLALAAQVNVETNHLAQRVEILCRDMKTLRPADLGGPVDLVVSNPPYGKTGGGRLGPDEEKTAAMHEIFASLADVVQTAARLLKGTGTLAMIYPASRLADLIYHLRKAKLEPKRLRMVHPAENADANRALVGAVKYGRPGLAVEAPLLVHRTDGSYTLEVEKMFEL